MSMKRGLSIGDLASRTGLSVSAIRFYEKKGLITPDRNEGNQRRFEGSDIRRLSFILIAQQMGLTIDQIKTLMASLPEGRTPTKADWTKISRTFRKTLDDRIAMMERTREKLDGCIGCGCLSLKVCSLYNPDDKARRLGVGPRYIVSDER